MHVQHVQKGISYDSAEGYNCVLLFWPLWLGAGYYKHHLHGGPLDSVMQAKIISLGPLCKNRGFRTSGDLLQDPRAGSLVVGVGSSGSVFWEVEAQEMGAPHFQGRGRVLQETLGKGPQGHGLNGIPEN